MNKENFWGVLTLLLIGFLVIGIITHAYGFSLAAGTLFQGVQGLGTSLEAGSIASGGTKVR
jgi:hypothetical protein